MNANDNIKQMVIHPDIVNHTIALSETWKEINFIPPVNKLYFIQEGEIEIDISGQVITASQGDLLFLPKNIVQSRSISTDSLDHYWMHFTCPLLGSNLDMVDTITFPYMIHVKDHKRIKDTFDKLIELTHKKELTSRLELISETTGLLSYFFEHAGGVKSKSTDSKYNQLTKIRLFIQDHLNQKLTIEELANQMHVHPNYFNTMFKKYFDISPKQYINSLKIQRAKELLIASNQTIEEIATNLGYQDKFYFSRLFKSKIGTSPQHFRKLLRENTIVNKKNGET